MKPKFVIWTNKVIRDACSLYELTGVDKDYQLRKGVPRAAGFPREAAFAMDPDRPNDTLLTDNLFNTDLLIVGSRELREFFETQGVPKLEYLPVAIIDHKGKKVSREYFIINPIEPVDCIDFAKSEITWDEMDKAAIEDVSRLVIDETKVEPARALFRPKGLHQIIMVRREIAEKIDAKGFTGIRWTELNKFSM
jgi:uncharacterized protein DUF1629